MQPQTLTTADIAPPKIIRRIKGYCCEWGIRFPSGKFGNDFTSQFTFLRGCFDEALASGREIIFSTDLNGQAFARTSDGTLRLTSDETGLLVEATLIDTPANRELIRHIDCGRVRGWSFRAQPGWGGFTVRTEGGIEFTDHHRAGLSEVCLVVNKIPRAKTRKTPIFI